MSLTKQATKGMLWSGISQMTNQVLSFTVTLILARLLVPEDFGLIGMSSIFIGVMLTFNEMGLSSGIIQRKDLEAKQINACFWMGLIVGITLCVVTILISPFVAQFFNEPRLDLILKVSSFIFIIGGLVVVPRSLLIKEIQFKEVSKGEIASEIIADLITVTLAFSGFGVWSLVFKNLILNTILATFYWIIHPWRPSLKLDFSGFKEIFHFSSSVMGTNIVGYAQSNIDNLFIGKTLGAPQLGIYTIAFNMTTFPMRKISSVVTNVVYPVFSKIQDDNEKLRKGYLKTTSLLSTITFPIVAGIFAVAPEFVTELLGQKWTPAILPLQILCLSGFVGSLSTLSWPVFLAKGKSALSFKLSIVNIIILAISIYLFIPYGIIGVSVAVAVVSTTMGLVRLIIANKLIGLSIVEVIKATYSPTISSLLMIISVFLFKELTIKYYHLNSIYLLLGSIVIGCLVYLIILRQTHKNIINEIKEILENVKSKSP